MTDGGTAGWEAADGFSPGNDFRILMGGDLTSSSSPTGILAFGFWLLVPLLRLLVSFGAAFATSGAWSSGRAYRNTECAQRPLRRGQSEKNLCP